LVAGRRREAEFLALCHAKNLLPGLAPNPLRDKSHLHLPEFTWKDRPLDLKDHRIPFFEASRVRGIPARYALTLDENDVRDVNQKYPDCLLAFYVHWEVVRYQKIEAGTVVHEVSIQPLRGLWLMERDLMNRLVSGKRPHAYQRRRGDTRGNAQTSYSIDLRLLSAAWIDPVCPPLHPLRPT
jgi:hypothetical protein